MLLSEEITNIDIEEEDEIEYPDLLLSLVIARCPVGLRVDVEGVEGNDKGRGYEGWNKFK